MSNSAGDRALLSLSSDAISSGNSLASVDRLDLLSSFGNKKNSSESPRPDILNQDVLALGQANIYQSVFDQNSTQSDRLPLAPLRQEPMLIADVVIHSGADGQVPGHQSIEITNAVLGRLNYSFATDNQFAPSFGTGRVYFDEAGLNGPEERRYRLTPEQDRMVLDYLNRRREDWDGSRYSLSNRNCRNFVNEIEQFVRPMSQ